MPQVAPVFRGNVDDEGRLQALRPEKLKAYLLTLARKPVLITIERETNRRSLAQNRYYHGVIIEMIASYTGNDEQDVHDFLKSRFLKREVLLGRTREEVVGSTTGLTTEQFEDYCERCRAWAAQELEMVIPLPNEVSDNL